MRLNIRHNRDTPIIQNILIPEYFWNTDGFAHDDFWHCETKTNDRIVIPLLSINFWNENNSETQTGSPAMIFGDVRQKKSKNCDTPIIEKILIPEHFWNAEGFAHDVFRRFGTKKFRREKWHPTSYPWTFSVLELFWKTKAFPHEIFRYCETKGFPRKIVKHPYFA